MGNYTSSFIKDQSKGREELNKFLTNEIPRFQDIYKDIENNKINIDKNHEYLDDLFERCCFLKLSDFYDKYGHGNNQSECSNVAVGDQWYFHCNDCSKDMNTCLCLECFLLNGDHIEKGHTFYLKSYQNSTCDCGNETLIHKEGFCSEHKRRVSTQSIQEHYQSLPLFLRKDLHVFFRYVFGYIINSSLSISEINRHSKINSEIIRWLTTISENSALLQIILFQEITNKVIYDQEQDNKGISAFERYSHQDVVLGNIQRTYNSFLEFYLRNLIVDEGISKSFQDLLFLIGTPNEFREEILEVFIKCYPRITKNQDVNTKGFLEGLTAFYAGHEDIYIKMCKRENDNLLDVIIQGYLDVFEPKLNNSFRNTKVTEYYGTILISSCLISIFSKKEVVEFLFTEKFGLEILEKYFKFVSLFHRATSKDIIDFNEPICNFMIIYSLSCFNLVGILHFTIKKHFDEEKHLQFTKILLEMIIRHIEKIPRYDVLYIRDDANPKYLLPRDSYHSTISHKHIIVYYPLYTSLGIVLMVDPNLYIPLIKDSISSDIIVQMSEEIFIFLFVYLTHESDPYPSLFRVLDSDEIIQTFLLQLSVKILGPDYFMHVFFNSIGCLVSTKNNSYERPYRILAKIFQTNLNFQVKEDDLKYHFSNWILSKKFSTFQEIEYLIVSIYPLYHPFLYRGVEKPEFMDNLKSIFKSCIKDNNLIDLKDECLEYYDDLYPYYSQSDQILISTYASEEYMKRMGLLHPSTKTQLIAPPCYKALLPTELQSLYDLYKMTTFYDIFFIPMLKEFYKSSSSTTFYQSNESFVKLFQSRNADSSYLSKESIYILLIILNTYDLLILDSNNTPSLDEVNSNIDGFYSRGENEFILPKNTNIIYNIIDNRSFQSDEKKISFSILDLLIKIFNNYLRLKQSDEKLLKPDYYLILDKLIQKLKGYNQSLSKYITNSLFDSEEQPMNNNNNQKDIQKDYPSKINYPNFYQLQTIKYNDKSDMDECNSCVVCNKGKDEDGLLLIGHINFTSAHNQTLIEKLVGSDIQLNRHYYEFVKSFYAKELTSRSQYLADRFDYFQLFNLYTFNRTYSTYHHSCNHKIHSRCFKASCADKNEFQCPKCKVPSNIVIPMISEKYGSAEDDIYNEYYLTITKLHFLEFISDKNLVILERFIWKAVFTHLEMLELKSRQCDVYSSEGEDTYTIYEDDFDFRQDLKLLKVIYQVIQKVKVNYSPEELLPINDKLIYISDVFTSVSYSHYITKKPLSEFTEKSTNLELFKIIISHILEYDEKYYTIEKLSYSLLYKSFTQFIQKKDTKVLEDIKFEIFPYLRKLYILDIISNQSNLDLNLFSVNDFANYDTVCKHFNFDLLRFMESMDPVSMLHDFLSLSETPNGLPIYGVYPPPLHYKKMFRFMEIPIKFVDLIKIYSKRKCKSCSSLAQEFCMICDKVICTKKECVSYPSSHWYECPSTNISYYIQIVSPCVKVTRKGVQVGTSKNFCLFNTAADKQLSSTNNTDKTFENTVFNEYPQLSNELVMDKNRLKYLYKLYYN